MSEWITQREAGEILGVHKSRVAKLVAAGKLTPRPHLDHRASLNRAEVVALAEWRAEAPARAEKARERRAAEREAAKTYHRPPGDEHEWLSVRQVAELLEVSSVAVLKRCQRDRLPHVWHGEQIWIRRDLLELVERAREVQRQGGLNRSARVGPLAPTPRPAPSNPA